jgi:hypothetical protein
MCFFHSCCFCLLQESGRQFLGKSLHCYQKGFFLIAWCWSKRRPDCMKCVVSLDSYRFTFGFLIHPASILSVSCLISIAFFSCLEPRWNGIYPTSPISFERTTRVACSTMVFCLCLFVFSFSDVFTSSSMCEYYH